MPRPRRKRVTKKERIGITPDPALINWVIDRMGPGLRFASVTQAFELGIVALQEQEGKNRPRWEDRIVRARGGREPDV